MIRVHNSQRKMRVRRRELQRFADEAFRVAKGMKQRRGGVLHQLARVDVVLVSDARMAALHQRFMNIAGATDVITFQHGEIFISVETATANARRFCSEPDAEIRLYIAHGLLHLLGFDDTTPRAAAAMAEAQDRLVATVDGAIE